MTKAKDHKEEGFHVGQVYSIPLKELKLNEDQPRKYFDQEALESLKGSIEDYDLLNPILFRIDENGEKILVAGERRVKVMLDLGKEFIQGRLVDGDPDEISLVENIVREDLNIIEKAESLAKMKENKHYDTVKLGKIIGKKHNTVSELIGLTRLTEEIKAKCRVTDRYSFRQLKKISTLEPKDQKVRFALLEYQTDETKNKPSKVGSAGRLKKVASLTNRFSKIKESLK